MPTESNRLDERLIPAIPRPCAVGPHDSIGRLHAEPTDPLRDPFEVDRHRILASAAFRRLQYKTQVFVYDEHDHFRTRLTHTLEVAEIARRLAVALNVNERLAETIALAHDLGHPPFGHAGEATLRARMADAGGFEHNVQSLRIVDYLEHPYPGFRGLNLTYEVREGLVKHLSAYDQPDAASAGVVELDALLESGPWPTVEGQIVSLADRMAYDCHDLEDALEANLIGPAALNELALWQSAADSVRRRFGDLATPAVRRPILTTILDRLLTDVIEATTSRLRESPIDTIDGVRRAELAVVTFSPLIAPLIGEIEGFLAANVYRHHRLVRMDAKARRFIERLFKAYLSDPAMLPPRFARRLDAEGSHRVICDYIAGMTDRYCLDEYQRLFEPHERV